MSLQFNFVLVAGGVPPHAVVEISQISTSENYICLSPEVRLQILNRKFQNVCFVENVNWFAPEG